MELCKDADDLINGEIDSKKLSVGVVTTRVVHVIHVQIVNVHIDLIVDRVHTNVVAFGMRLYKFKFLCAVL